MGGQAGTHEHKNVWTGFAGVAQTTVERLLREGGARDEDATAAPLADKLATLQHIVGGAAREYRARSIERLLAGSATLQALYAGNYVAQEA